MGHYFLDIQYNFVDLGNSLSMMDHYYDKLLQIAVYKENVVQNKYLVGEAAKVPG